MSECSCYEVKCSMGSRHIITCAKCINKATNGEIEYTEDEKDFAENAWKLLKEGNKK